MNLDRHVFISYAHIDNQPWTAEQKGWVTMFQGTLQTMLSQRMGAKAKIWKDEKLRGNDIFSKEILDQLPKTASLISVLTPRYVNSEWCVREINEFCNAAQQTGGLVVNNKSRVLSVIKTPVGKKDSLPPIVNTVLGYEFYDLDDDNTPRELDPAFGEKSRQEFLRKTNRIAWDIAELLAQMAAMSLNDEPAKDKVTPKPTVYLAECSRDRRGAREVLEDELKRHGYAVLPDRPLPSDEAEYVAEVERNLAASRFSIHLIGTGYGLVPDGPSQKSVVAIQNELAVKRARSGLLRRVIWLPEGTQSEHAAQQSFIAALHRDAEAQFGADLVTGDLESLKGAIHAELKKLDQPEQAKPAKQADTGSARKLIYILCDVKDRNETIPLLKFLKARGFEVKLPVFMGNAAEVREANQELSTICDAVLLFYGAGDEAWKYHQQNELRKTRSARRDKSTWAEYIYLASPIADDKTFLLNTNEPNVIDGLKGFSEASLEPFLQAVEASGANR
jgi:hypothetical protein